MSFEDLLLQGIPRGEAAAYMVRLRGFNKVATIAETKEALAALPADERQLIIKRAADVAPTALPPTAMGNNTVAAAPPTLPATGQGQNPVKMAGAAILAYHKLKSGVERPANGAAAATPKTASDKSPHERGVDSGLASTAAHFEREKHRRHEGHGAAAGALAGGGAGYATTRKAKSPLAKLVGVALGAHLGSKAGRGAGAQVDAHRWKKRAGVQRMLWEVPEQIASRKGLAVMGGVGAALGAQKASDAKRNPVGGAVRGGVGAAGGAVAGGAVGASVGMLVGLAGAALVNAKSESALEPVVLGALAGTAVGMAVGGVGGHKLLTNTYKNKHAYAFKLALQESGMAAADPTVTPPGVPPEGAGAPMAEPQAVQPSIDPAMQQYLAKEQQGEAAAEEGHSDMLRQQLQQAHQELQQTQMQAETLQQAQAQHDQQIQQMQGMVSTSTQQAQAAQDQALQQQQASSAMRMAFQQLRGQVLQLASTDPPMMSQDAQALLAAQQPQQGAVDPATGQPMAQPAAAPMPGAPAPAAAPQEAAGGPAEAAAAPAPAAEEPAAKSAPPEKKEEKKDEKGSGKVSVKVGAAAMREVARELFPLGSRRP